MAFKQVEIPEIDHDVAAPKTVLGFSDSTHTFEHEDNGTYFLGRGNRTRPDIMFVSSCPLEEELDDKFSPAMLLKGSPGALLGRSAMRAGIDLQDHYYTTLCKYCLPRSRKLKPDTVDLKRCAPLFEKELKQRKPKVVVCLGKPVFDYFYDLRFKEKEIMGGWFEAPEHKIKVPTGKWITKKVDGEEVEEQEMQDFECYRDFHLFVMQPIHIPVVKPEVLEGQLFDLIEVRRHLDFSETNESEQKIKQNYTLLDTVDKVAAWSADMITNQYKVFSVDCEWGGEDYMSGDLRSVQACWKPGQAMCLQFFNEKGERTFSDEGYKQVLKYFQAVMNQPDVRFIGHNFAADYVWLKHWLGVDPYKRCIFDTMYAMHCVDESYDLKLERLSIRFTTLGRYDIPLAIWKKKNKKKMNDGGYGAVPTEILFPYSCADVDVPFRAWPKLTKLLVNDGTYGYFYGVRLPYVTDGYAHMSESGMPLNRNDTRKVRKNFTMVSELMLETFKARVREKADFAVQMLVHEHAEDPVKVYNQLVTGEINVMDLKNHLGAKVFAEKYETLKHWEDARDFNPNSSHKKIRWLFEFKGHTPIKSTATDDGPSVDWEKVEALPEAQRKNYRPSTDKDVLAILGEGDEDIKLLLEYLAVYQVIKTFLKTEGQGLEKYIRDDGKVHTNFLITETGRPKSFQPNILNLPAYLSKRVTGGFERAKEFLKKVYGTDEVDEAYARYLETKTEEERAGLPDKLEDPVPVRWCFKAPKDWCFIDMDYATAEVFSIAYLANDKNLIARLTEPDPQFVMIKDPETGEESSVRVGYVEGVTPYAKSEWDPELVTPMEEIEDRIVRNEDGSPKRPKRDVHWEMCEHELFMNKPREKMQKSKERAAGKVGNFQIPYQSSAGLLNMLIEIATGEAPPKETGENLINVYKESNPEAWDFLERVMNDVVEKGCYVSPTGAKRHFHVHRGGEVSRWRKKSILSGLRRQASNYPMQSLVADYLAKAVVMLVEEFRKRGMKSTVVTPLYDALYIHAPITERKEAERLMVECLKERNFVDLPGGRLKFNLDCSITKRWSIEPTDDELKELG